MENFEKDLARLESIADQLRDGTVSLSDATGLYEEGVRLARTLDGRLRKIEQRVEILSREPGSVAEEPELTLFGDSEPTSQSTTQSDDSE